MESQGKLSGLKVSHLMSGNVICIEENDPVSFVIKIFDRCHISGAPVTNGHGDYVGVVSKTDLFDRTLLDFLNQHGSLDDLPVRYIMNQNPPLSVPEDTSVERAAEIMLHHHIHRIFVTDHTEKIIGVVSSYDILRVVANPPVVAQPVEPDNVASLKEQQILNLREQLQKKKTAKHKG